MQGRPGCSGCWGNSPHHPAFTWSDSHHLRPSTWCKSPRHLAQMTPCHCAPWAVGWCRRRSAGRPTARATTALAATTSAVKGSSRGGARPRGTGRITRSWPGAPLQAHYRTPRHVETRSSRRLCIQRAMPVQHDPCHGATFVARRSDRRRCTATRRQPGSTALSPGPHDQDDQRRRLPHPRPITSSSSCRQPRARRHRWQPT